MIVGKRAAIGSLLSYVILACEGLPFARFATIRSRASGVIVRRFAFAGSGAASVSDIYIRPNPGRLRPNPDQLRPNPGRLRPNLDQLRPNPGRLRPNPGQLRFIVRLILIKSRFSCPNSAAFDRNLIGFNSN